MKRALSSPAPHLAAILLGSFALPGCVGITWVGTTTTDSADPTSLETRRPRPRPGQRREEDLLRAFGEPDVRQQVSDAREVWIYDDGWRWNGPVIFAVIPIPLVIPVGTTSTTYHLHDGNIERVVLVQTEWSGFVCGAIGHFEGCNSLSE